MGFRVRLQCLRMLREASNIGVLQSAVRGDAGNRAAATAEPRARRIAGGRRRERGGPRCERRCGHGGYQRLDRWRLLGECYSRYRGARTPAQSILRFGLAVRGHGWACWVPAQAWTCGWRARKAASGARIAAHRCWMCAHWRAGLAGGGSLRHGNLAARGAGLACAVRSAYFCLFEPELSFSTLPVHSLYSPPRATTDTGHRTVERRIAHQLECPTRSIMLRSLCAAKRAPRIWPRRVHAVAQDGGAIAVEVPFESIVTVTIRSSTIADCHALVGTSGAVRARDRCGAWRGSKAHGSAFCRATRPLGHVADEPCRTGGMYALRQCDARRVGAGALRRGCGGCCADEGVRVRARLSAAGAVGPSLAAAVQAKGWSRFVPSPEPSRISAQDTHTARGM